VKACRSTNIKKYILASTKHATKSVSAGMKMRFIKFLKLT